MNGAFASPSLARWRPALWTGLSLLALLALASLGCGALRLRDQPSFKPQEAPRLALPASSVPTEGKERELPPAVRGEGPSEIKALSNPVPAAPDSLREGEAFYRINCLMCHGEQGRGDGPVGEVFAPRPADLSSPDVQRYTDGELFWKITTGVTTMPPFKSRLSPEERWHVVNFLRTLRR